MPKGKDKDTANTNLNHASNARSTTTTTIPSSPSSSLLLFSSSRRHPPPPVHDSAVAMGQAESTARSQFHLGPPPPPSPQPTSKLRFGWLGRRNKSEDLSRLALPTPTTQPPLPSPVPPMAPPSSMRNTTPATQLARQDSELSSLDGPPPTTLQMRDLSRPPSRSSSAKQLTMQFASNTLSALKGKLNASQASLHSSKHSDPASSTSPPLPPLPPKGDASRMSQSSSQSDNNQSGAASTNSNSNSNKVAPSPKHTPPDLSAHPTAVETHHRPQNEIAPTAMATPSSSLEDGINPSSHTHDVNSPQRRERERREQTAKEIADDWRKSDSTLRTVRLVGSRTPRPLSLAESTNSGHTVLPTVGAATGKRLSALMTDADFGLKEVDSEEDDNDVDEPSSSFASSPPSAFNSVHDLQQQEPGKPQPQPTSRRGSLSIRIGRLSGSKSRVTEHGQLSGGSDSDALSSSVSTRATGTTDMGMLTANSSTTSVSSSCLAGTHSKDPGSRPSIEIASNASISSTMSSQHHPHLYAQYKANAKLDPFIGLPATNQIASESQASLSTSESASLSSHPGSSGRHMDGEKIGRKHPGNMSPPHGPTLRPAHHRTRLQSIQARGFRQTAVSITTGFANPAAGFARKAVDKLGRALGGSSASLPTPDAVEIPPAVPVGHGHSSSVSGSGASLFGMTTGQQHPPHERHRRAPHPPSSSKKAMRKHRASPSGTWSVNSSDTDGGLGPHLGRCLRGALMPYGNQKGLVFSRDLESCVRDTACTDAIEDDVEGLSLSGRSLPALVVRCAQHIVKWGVQEEGLFRISGRSTHISKLRAEFDCGADYDLRECGPGAIDPHAVASVFKTFLRELPEPLLTHRLAPYFEAALAAENNRNKDADAQTQNSNGGAHQNGTERMRGPGLPANPRDSAQLRKAPSLSTFTVPTLSPHSASRTLLSAFSILIARLPKENRDVLRTVTELIMATARASRETKMPLSNLLLVFCPTLCMSPPMLRVLCEGLGIWDGPLEVEDPEMPITMARGNETIAEQLVEEDNDRHRGSEESEIGLLHHQATIKRPSMTASGDNSVKSTADDNGNASENGLANGPSTSVPSLILPPDDGKTFMTTGHTRTGSSVSTSAHPPSPEGLVHSSSSSDSLHTPPSSTSGSASPNMSLVPSASVASPVTLDTKGFNAKLLALRAQSDLPSPLSPSATKRTVRKSLIGNPVPFPLGIGMSRSASGCSAPVTPTEFGAKALGELSLASHSTSSLHLLPNNGVPGGASSTASTPSRLGRRKSKVLAPGLRTKRSLSSLLRRAQDEVQTTPLRSAVPDLATVQEPASPPRSSTPCPVLNLPVDTTRLGDGLGLSINDEPEATPDSEEHSDASRNGSTLRVPSPSPPCSSSPSPVSSLSPRGQQGTTSMMMDRSESDSSAITSNSVFYTPPTTVCALAPAANNSTSSSSGASSSGSYSFLDFNLSKGGDEDDWAKSVLQAAASDT